MFSFLAFLGPCNFENGLCQWSDASVGPNTWNRVKATNTTDPPNDHTTGTGNARLAQYVDN